MGWVLGKYVPYLYIILRVMAGVLFACHGAQKLFGVLGGFGGQPGVVAPLWSLMGAAGLIEFIGGLLIALGVLASYAALIASGEMAVAYFTLALARGFWPIQNGGELAVLYCFLFLFIAANGATLRGVEPRRPASTLPAMEQDKYSTSLGSE
jgi:putative oxidoreductase